MNNDLSTLTLNELYDKLSEFTTLYSKSMVNGFSEKDFAELRSQIEAIQKEITTRKASVSTVDGRAIIPPQQSASA